MKTLKIDPELAREIKAVNGDGSRETRFAYMKKVEDTRKDLSRAGVDAGENFAECLKEHGRATVAICVAATLDRRHDRLENWGFLWARGVLELWTNRPPSGIERACIRDETRHPTAICAYAGDFIRATAYD